MCKYILVYHIDDYAENGGGTDAEEFGMDEYAMHKRVNELGNQKKEKFGVIFAGFLQTEFEYEAVEIVTEYKPKQKRP